MGLAFLQAVSIGFVAFVVVVVYILISAVKIVKEYERGVIFASVGSRVGRRGQACFCFSRSRTPWSR